MGWKPGTGANVQPWQYFLPDANEGTRTGANVHPWQYSLPDANGDTRRAQRQKTVCNFLQTWNG